MHPRVKEMLEAHQPLYLDLNPGERKDPRAIGLDWRPLPGIEIVHEVTDVPWPLPDGCCYRILATHIIQFIEPRQIQGFMDECWRVLCDTGQLLVATIYAGTPQYWANPWHVSGWNEASAFYFDCSKPLWQERKPRCWEIPPDFPQWHTDGNLNILFNKRPGAHEDHAPKEEDADA